MEAHSDIFIIGGGINGTAIAADAAGRGLSVTLCEKNDLAAGTSSASSKLIHGGLRYLASYEWSLVRSALREQEILLRNAPHLISPLEFILPHEKHLRSAWLIRLGLFFYDHLILRRSLPRSRTVNLRNYPYSNLLLSKFKKGFSYFDCLVDDARLVIANALSAKKKGANILTYTTFLSANRENTSWKIELQDNSSKIIFYRYAKTLINVSGPWVKEIQKKIIGSDLSISVMLDKGSHIIVPKLYENHFSYILQATDNRIVFTIPFQEKFTLIGTTDTLCSENLDALKITAMEEEYLCSVINHYFKQGIHRGDIVWSYAGVRCLKASYEEDLAMITRDNQLLLEDKNNLPLLTVIGGKLTMHRFLAEQVLAKLQFYFPQMGKAWTAYKALPGGDIHNKDFSLFLKQLQKEFSWLPVDLVTRYAKNYGTCVYLLLNSARNLPDLGEHLGHGLYQKEVEYLIEHEWAKKTDDILWRRTKLGLLFSKSDIKKLNHFLESAR